MFDTEKQELPSIETIHFEEEVMDKINIKQSGAIIEQDLKG